MDDPTSTPTARWRPPAWLDATAAISWRFLLVVAAASLVVAGLAALSVVAVPLVLALFLASALQPLAGRLRRAGAPPALAAGGCVLLMVVGFGLLGWLVTGALVDPWDGLARHLSHGLDVLQDRIGSAAGTGTGDDTQQVRSEVGHATSWLLNGTLRVVSVVTSLLSTALLSLLILFFYLKDGERLWAWIVSLGGHHQDVVARVGSVMWQRIHGFVRGTAAVAAVDAAGISLGALLLGVPSVAAIGALTLVMAFIPYFGAFLAGLVACLLAVSSAGLGTGLAMLGVVLLVQLFEGNLLQPMLVGRAVEVHPLTVALGVIAGGAVAGVLGMFVAVPLIAATSAGIQELRRPADLQSLEPAARPPDPTSTRSPS